MSASEILTESGLKCTKQREAVLSVLISEEKPITAEQIQAKSNINLATVYRILDQLCEHNVIIKSKMLDNNTASYELDRHEHKHYAVCIDCKEVTPIEDCHYHPHIADGFEVTGHKIEVYGYCKKCKLKHGGKDK